MYDHKFSITHSSGKEEIVFERFDRLLGDDDIQTVLKTFFKMYPHLKSAKFMRAYHAEEIDYTFESVPTDKLYQVRLNGEFVTYSNTNSPKAIDNILAEFGWENRRVYYEHLMKERVDENS